LSDSNDGAVFRRRRQPPEDPNIRTILVWLMRVDAKLDRLELLVRGEDPDEFE
jgi:hypothetical protein